MFLYILKLTKYNVIKIGIANNDNRIIKHLNTYEEIDLDNSYKVFANSDKIIKQLEKQILCDYYDFKVNNIDLINKDGYTEIRQEIVLQNVLEDLKYKENKFPQQNIKIVKGIKINNSMEKQYNKQTVDNYDILKERNKLSLRQNNIIDILISELNDAKLFYNIEICNYIKYFNNDTSNIYRDFEKAVKDFHKNDFNWFKGITYVFDNGKIQIKLSDEIRNALLGFKSYIKLKHTLNFNSMYSQRLYYYFKRLEVGRLKKENIRDLQVYLNCPKTYTNFSNFKKFVLDPANKDINDKTDINFEYSFENVGKKIEYIYFKFH